MKNPNDMTLNLDFNHPGRHVHLPGPRGIAAPGATGGRLSNVALNMRGAIHAA